MNELSANSGRNKYVYLIYFVFFALLFLQFPLNNSLPQNIDTWFNLAAFQNFSNQITSFFNGSELGVTMYPYRDAFRNGDPTWGSSLIFNLIEYIINNKMWSYYLFMVFLYSFNALSVFLVIDFFVRNSKASFFGGFAFAASNYSLALMDNQNAIFLSFVFLSIFNFLKYSESGKTQQLIYAAITGGLSIHFCGYSIIYMPIMLFFVSVYLYFTNKDFKILNTWLIYGAIFILLVAPIFLYVKSYKSQSTESLINNMLPYSLHFSDFFRAIKGNMLLDLKSDLPNVWQYNSRAVYCGISIFITAFLFLLKSGNKWFKISFISMFLSCMVFALGPKINFLNHTIYMPQYFVFKYLDFSLFFRNPVRIYQLCIFIVCLFSASWWSKFISGKKYQLGWIAVAMTIYMLENLPRSFEKFSSYKYIEAPNALKVFFQNKSDVILAQFPSGITFSDKDVISGINPINRDFIYMYWATEVGYSTVNGFTSAYNDIRFKNDSLMSLYEYDIILKEFLSVNKINFVTYHFTLNTKGEDGIYQTLQNSTLLNSEYKNDEIEIFKCVSLNTKPKLNVITSSVENH